MRRGSDFIAQLALAVTVCWAVVLALTGSTDLLLFLAPALLIAIPLVSGRYVGERLIARLVAERTRWPRRSAVASTATPRRPAIWLPRGTRLVAFSLAERPPPGRLLRQT